MAGGLLIGYRPERLLLAQVFIGRQRLSCDFMNFVPKAESGCAMSSLSKPQPDTAGLTASLPVGKPPPELEQGGLAVAIDEAGLIVAAEPICAALFQQEPAELVGQPLEVLLLAGADKIRQQLVPSDAPPDSDTVTLPRLFALARRKDDTSFAVAVTLKREAGCWWALAFHDVNPPPVAQPESRAAGLLHPTSTPGRRRARAATPLDLESIPDIFFRAPAKPAPQPEPPATAPAAIPEPPALAPPTPLNQDQLAPGPPPTQPVPPKSDAPLREPEQRPSERHTEFRRLRAHPQPLDQQPHAAGSAPKRAAAALEEATARRTQLEAQPAQARPAGDEPDHQPPADQPPQAETEIRLRELEQRLAQTAEDLKRGQAQRPPPPVPAPAPNAEEPALRDQLLELETRLRTAVASLARTTAELETERGERRRSQQRAATLAAEMQQLHEQLKNHLAAEQTDHQRFTELEHQLHEQAQQHDLAVAKLQSAAQREQSERKRLEAELLRARFLSSDSARAGRAQVNGLRRQLQPPVENLHQAACRLLQLQLSDDQKQLLQTVLENILLLQTSIQESPET